MPSKRIAILDKTPTHWNYILWADVPSGQEIKYQSPLNTSRYQGATPTDILALRNGTVVERFSQLPGSLSLAAAEAAMQDAWTAFSSAITAGAEYMDYGTWWNGTTWTSGGPSTLVSITAKSTPVLPTWLVVTPVTGLAANKFQLVLFNNTTVYNCLMHLIVLKPETTVVTGAIGSNWNLRRRVSPTTNPAGGTITPLPHDSSLVLPTGISLHIAPTTAPAGGTAQDLLPFFMPVADELLVNTLNPPGFAACQPLCGVQIWNSSLLNPSVPLVIRPQQTLEVQQTTTAGTGNCRLFAMFQVEDQR